MTNEKKRILFILPNLQGGGAERVTIDIMKSMDKKKFTPVLFLFENEGVYFRDIPNDIEVITSLKKEQNFKTKFYLSFFRLLKEAKKADVIIGALELTSSYFAAITGKLLNKPTIGWVHVNMKYFPPAQTKFHKFFTKVTYKWLDQIITVSNGAAADFRKLYPGIKADIATMYNPLLVDEIVAKSKEPVSVHSEEVPVIIGVGRLAKQKGFDVLIKAHKILVDRGINHQLLIVGEGSERDYLQSLINELNLSGTVSLIGFTNNPYKYMKQATVFALSSRFEGFGMVIVEAMSLGLPVVSTDCPSGPGEILQDGESGLIVPQEDPEQLSQAMETLLQDKEQAEAFSKKSMQRANDFLPSVIMPQFERILFEVLGK